MMLLWGALAAMALLAMGFVLLPLLQAPRPLPAPAREAQNVALYREQLAQWQAEAAEGSVNPQGLEAAKVEAARALLADSAAVDSPAGRADRRLPVVLALLMPLVAAGLYAGVGAGAKVALSERLATPPTSAADMRERLEAVVRAQPDGVEALYYLARAYMAENRPADAAALFERAVALTGRSPELLGQWAQARYFAANKQWSPALQALADEALRANPNEATTLGLLGIAAFESQRYADAAGWWARLQAQMAPNDPARLALQGGIDRARERAGVSGAPGLRVRVSLAPAVARAVQPTDTVFVFARALNGPPLPLAVKRLTVAQLPATLTLSDADAMQPSLKLSSATQVQLGARISRQGQPTQGEWLGRGATVAPREEALQFLIIDSPDP
ncbi:MULTISPECIES: c-type cytochrome biogenesis protein CcmI [unclassified Pseudomonas]|uniref:c-type cytochrome biogenesis protein CcmI n=1 Tax=unclassified Pseudomonas TaxID=196821 RepID=UPI000BD3A246|nr:MULTISPECIES: c-type cytochrome biogenesis protein CcmI [unclassified Pseudomonas]PVZ13637.1 cytochrome c-type biogenesis protein CcmH [Pseudomonas sp. URIL14HWK12:I12]PVZ23943.1 cytochrome c-type biogenesis protein CcmH [Pseudomonas sp. URIL14HWK12:I10]PVZ33418.1 cytochrome c-type biogenesis protein CcmH [Pseudomonas sp. URIL14HWK12:I11]SNZ11491.1 cytochrome c-type biogenesis protein CcmH [Pseudomonas sp. URIL14HWK12:I9]